MPTKTDRILGYLPETFITSPRPEVLYPLVDAFGNELLLGENSLAAIMLSHWVDFADKNASQINDLEKLAALYGLAPWREESGETLETVEEFREHLKRYVRTYLEGTVTVQGILRVTAETLGLRIAADEADQLDRWWTRTNDAVVTTESPRNDAAVRLNFERRSASGSSASPAQMTGSVDLSEGVNLQGTNILRVKVDGAFHEINLTEGLAPTATLTLQQIVEVINRAPLPAIASHDGRHLSLSSTSGGPAGKLEIVSGPNDAAPRLLGLAARSYHGAPATRAEFKSNVDLTNPVDLSNERYLRLQIDGTNLAEIDVAGPDPSNTTLNNIRDRINDAFPELNVADHDGKHLILRSPKKGLESRISVLFAAAQDAAGKILGVSSLVEIGNEAKPARVDSTRDLRTTIDLSERSNIRLRIDGTGPLTINCAGVNSEKTQRTEILEAINAAFQKQVAVTNDRGISVISPVAGPASEIVFEPPNSRDATLDIFGIGPLIFKGSAPTVARLVAAPTLTGNGIDVRANNLLLLALDGGSAVEIDLREAAQTLDEARALPLNRVTDHINQAFAPAQVASTDGEKLFLTSPRSGGVSKVEVLARETTRKRRFVTRAIVTDEAAQQVFGFIEKTSRGTPPTSASLAGDIDLSLSADLTTTRFLRLQVDGFPAVEIDCAGGRPRATTLAEVISRINSALRTVGLTVDVAKSDGKHLRLLSPSQGATSRIAILPPRVALDKLLGVEPGTFRGADATSVNFTGTADLSAGVALPANAKIKLGIDGAPAAEIVLNGSTPIRRSPFEIANAINTFFKAQVATTDGRLLELHSAKKGANSQIKFEVPAADDVTRAIFGIAGPREYHGAVATRARVTGKRDLSGSTDLSVFRSLVVSFDGAAELIVDCASKAPDPKAVTLSQIVEAIGTNASASPEGKFLILTSPSAGPTAQVSLHDFPDVDASRKLLGSSPVTATGESGLPARITGEKSLIAPVNLSRRGALRIAVDGSRTADIDVTGSVPAKTTPEEIVNRINRQFPNLATLDADSHLQLTSPTTDSASSVSLEPVRVLEVLEYPSRATPPLAFLVKHNDIWSVVNDGVTDTDAEIRITAPHGTVGPTVVNSGVDWSVHLFVVLELRETIRLFRDAQLGLQAEIIRPDGKRLLVAGSKIQSGPLGAQAVVPFDRPWDLSGRPPSLQLNNAEASGIVRLKALTDSKITVEIDEGDIKPLEPQTPAADGKPGRLVGRLINYKSDFRLVNADGEPIATLLPGSDVNLQLNVQRVVRVEGPIHSGSPPVILVQAIARLFDVKIYGVTDDKPLELYRGVSIGVGIGDSDSLVRQINGASARATASALVRAEELDKAIVLSIPPGKTTFRYLDCVGSRFNRARFNYSRFPDGVCGERGVFNVSRFNNSPPERIRPVFTTKPPFPEPPVKVEFRSNRFTAGSFVVNLPADLPPRFGARFNEARFGTDQPEVYAGAVAEPEDDDKFLVKLISPPSGDKSNLVKAKLVGNLETGFTAVHMPFRKLEFLRLGGAGRPARLYLKEDGLTKFILLEAREEGAWGNEIAVSARQAGAAIYDVSISYRGGRVEQARSIVLGAIKETVQELLQPGPSGVLQAKAAGVRVDVTRERAEYDQSTITP